MAWKKYKKYIIAIAIISIIWGLSIFCLSSLFKRINSKIGEIQAKITNQENETKRLEEMPKFQAQNGLIQQKEGAIPALLSKDNAVALIERLENLAEETGNQINIQVIDNASAPAKKTTTSGKKNIDTTILGNLPSNDYLDVKIKLSGDYNGLMNFVGKVENLEYYSDLVSVQINANDIQAQAQGTPESNGIGQSNNQAGEVSSAQKQAELTSNIEIVFYIQK